VHRAYASLPRVKITELLLEVDEWTGFTRHFTHLKSGDTAKDRILLLAVILADAINLGLGKMAESCPGSTYARLSWLQAWHIRLRHSQHWRLLQDLPYARQTKRSSEIIGAVCRALGGRPGQRLITTCARRRENRRR
jgi:hypothetical protein